MVLIQLTGSFAFFNLLGVALSLLLLDDRVWLPIYGLLVNHPLWQAAPPPRQFALLSGCAAILVLFLSIDSLARLFRAGIQWPQPLARLLDLFEPFHFVNSYGLFAVMTTWRPEIIVEGSYDGRNWEEYEFKWNRARFAAAAFCSAPPAAAGLADVVCGAGGTCEQCLVQTVSGEVAGRLARGAGAAGKEPFSG
jgi:hypothetical protein